MSKDRPVLSNHIFSVTTAKTEKVRATFGNKINDIPFELSNKTGSALERVPAFLEQLQFQG